MDPEELARNGGTHFAPISQYGGEKEENGETKKTKETKDVVDPPALTDPPPKKRPRHKSRISKRPTRSRKEYTQRSGIAPPPKKGKHHQPPLGGESRATRRIVTQGITATATLEETNAPVPGAGRGEGMERSFISRPLSKYRRRTKLTGGTLGVN